MHISVGLGSVGRGTGGSRAIDGQDDREQSPRDLRRELYARVRAAAGEDADLGTVLGCLCTIAVEVHRVTGAALTLMTPTDTRLGQVVAGGSDERARGWQELQLTLGEGPGIDAFESGRPVVVRDVDDSLHRWSGWAAEARRTGVGAALSLPLVLGASRFGALTVYDEGRRAWASEEQAALLDTADVATAILLDAVEPEGGAERIPGLLDVLDVRTEVYQAQGMVMAQLEVPLGEALALMRAHAYATGTSLTTVALAVLAGDLDLGDPEGP